MQRKTALIIGAAALVSVGLGTWAVVGGQAGVQYRTAPVDHGDINVAISSTGNPNAVVTVQAEDRETLESVVERVTREARSGDTVAILSNGTFGDLHARLVASLAARGAP